MGMTETATKGAGMATEAQTAALRDQTESADAGERITATLTLIAKAHYLSYADAKYAAQIALSGAHARARRCDICDDEITAGERFTDAGGEIAHSACTAQWFRANYGAEGLG